MTDAEKCRLIADWEGRRYDSKKEIWITPYPDQRDMSILPDYPHDLNATMRAARRLPPKVTLKVMSDGYAEVRFGLKPKDMIYIQTEPDPVRAGFLALAAYLEQRK